MPLIHVKPRGKPIPKLPVDINIPIGASVEALYHAVAVETRFPIERLRITRASDGQFLPSRSGKQVSDFGVGEESSVFVKDLGPQISWTTVFLIEYIGPLLIHPLVLFLRTLIQPSYHPTPIQLTACAAVVLHFLKREYETLYVHRFSAATMPASYIFRNSAHYWLFGGLFVALFLYAPSDNTSAPSIPALLLWAFAEGSNYYSHLTLRNLRPAGSTTRGVPTGYGFKYVTCPNYTFESLGWACLTWVTGNWAVGVFAVGGFLIMRSWAWKKEMKYRKEFPDYKKKNTVIVPFLL